MNAQREIVGYGKRAYERVREVVGTLKNGDPLAPVTVVVPNNLVGISLRRSLAAGVGGRPGVAAVEVTTIRRLAERIALADMSRLRPATRTIRAAAMRATVDAEPGGFEQVADHPATVEALMRASVELDELTDEELAELSQTAGLIGEVVRLHRQSFDRLAGSWYREVDLIRAASSQIAAFALGPVVIFLPRLLTATERALVDQLMMRDGTVLLIGAADDEIVDPDLTSASSDQSAVQADMIADVSVFHASDADDEVRCIVREVVEAVRAHPAHRVGVVYSAAAPYGRLLQEHLAAAGIQVAGRGIRSVRERAIPDAFMRLLALAVSGIDRAPLFAFLSRATTRHGHLDIPVARWDRLAREAGVVSDSDWSDRLAALRESRLKQRDVALERDEAARAEWHEGVADDAEKLGEFVAMLRTRLQHGRELRDWRLVSDWSTELFTSFFGNPTSAASLAAEERAAATSLFFALERLSELGDVVPEASIEQLISVVTSELDAITPRAGRFGEGVVVGPISDAVGLDLDRIFVLGLSDDLYPGRLTADPLIPDRIRDVAPSLPRPRERIDRMRRDLAAVTSSGAQVTLSFARGDLRRSTPRLPSRWMMPTLRQLSGDPDLVATDWEQASSTSIVSSASYWSSSSTAALPASAHEWRLRSAAAGTPPDDEVVSAAVELHRERSSERFTRFDGLVADVEGLPDFQAIGTESVAPTTLERYAICPHGYFVERLLGVRRVEDPEEIVTIRPVDVGNLIHGALDRLVSENAEALPDYGEAWTPRQRQRLREIAVEIGDQLEATGLTGHPLLWERARQELLADLDRMLDRDDLYRAQNDARVIGTELHFDQVQVPTAIDRSVEMRGSIDLIEQTRGGRLLVIDIKTGRSRSFDPINKDAIAAGTKLQLPIYARAAAEVYPTDDVEAMYWFVRDDDKRIRIELDDDLRARYSAAIGALSDGIASGIFPPKAPEEADHMWVQCEYCNPDGLGHGEVRARYERKRADPAYASLRALLDPAPESETERADG
ncbi:PD-(D/E)XK nuclease family protein [Schumannella sp. 10F1B-5-1]|uniref:PD-(D/E)XK nuclease family protein n=1 Tax=Schumannella sp. 10F1B-5-1 TaxID=2590780 RepID=UPI001132163F|nr:PD-(D/E)XK nuclease family protein [Schumannella sp. 10F1B-5-1]TPW72896.1 PD-(D/E)XK nuclease family protein [Schumannella sp. 10F1B-5-1]